MFITLFFLFFFFFSVIGGVFHGNRHATRVYILVKILSRGFLIVSLPVLKYLIKIVLHVDKWKTPFIVRFLLFFFRCLSAI